jgi:hypothetical protein
MTLNVCMQRFRTEHRSIKYACIAIKPYGLPFTLSKLHSHGHLPRTSARALAPSLPILLPEREISCNELLALSASGPVAQNI